MPNSQVPAILLNSDNTISIQVNVYGFDGGTAVEITGQATQDSGAIASFYSVQAVPQHDDNDSATIWVKSVPVVAPNQFDSHFPVTITVKAALAWVSQLGGNADPSLYRQPGDPVPKGAWQSTGFGAAVQPPPPVTPAPTVPAQ
jgi:hypothetical protein